MERKRVLVELKQETLDELDRLSVTLGYSRDLLLDYAVQAMAVAMSARITSYKKD